MTNPNQCAEAQMREAFEKWKQATWPNVGTMQGNMLHSAWMAAWQAALKSKGAAQGVDEPVAWVDPDGIEKPSRVRRVGWLPAYTHLAPAAGVVPEGKS